MVMGQTVAILSCNLGDFDKPIEPVAQVLPAGIDSITYHCYTYADFPQIADLPPRFQYRIPKMFGWQMFPGYDIYIWLDGSMSFTRKDCVEWFMDQLGDKDMLVFKHPWRKSAQQESDHIEDHLQKGKPYITSRYKNGLHKEQLADIQLDTSYIDDELFTSTVFVYRNTRKVQTALLAWWSSTSRFFTVDQIVFPYVLRKYQLDLSVIKESQYKIPYITLVSEHK